MIVRPTSEDVITGHLVQTLRLLNPRWWLPDLLNTAVWAPRFRRQVFRRLALEVWQNKPRYPRNLLPWNEGSTQVDATITWENPPTTVYLEMKYGSDLAGATAGNDGGGEFPNDQLIRNLRVGLWENGWLKRDGLFHLAPRDFVFVLIGPKRGHPLIHRYRDEGNLRRSIPRGELLDDLPARPFVGELSYSEIVSNLRRQRRWFTRPERQAIDGLTDYLEFKRGTFDRAIARETQPDRQTGIPNLREQPDGEVLAS